MGTKPHIRLKAQPTADSFQNFLTRTGIGTGNANDGARYGFNPTSRNRVLLENCYRGSWIAGAVIDSVADDMTREGVEILGDDKPEDIKALDKEANRLQLWAKLAETIKWSRLYGGSLGWLMIDGQNAETPLRLDTIRKGQFAGIFPLDRWMVQASLDQLVTELGPQIGKPMFYDVLPDTGTGLQRMRIHYSRVIRMEGVALPYWQRIAENHWGQSVLERLFDRLVAFDSSTAGTAQLVHKAHLRTYKVKDLRDIIAAGGPALAGLVKQIEMIRQYQSNEGMTLMDAEDEFEAHQYSFSGLDAVLLQLGQQLSGASGIPLVRLFGQSPAGLNSTGESDLRNYYDNIKQEQESELRPDIEKTYAVLYRSTHGRAPRDNFEIAFRPLWQMSDEQKANVTNSRTAAVVAAHDSQIISRSTALKELKAIGDVTGAYTNISDEEIKQAEDDPPPDAEALGLVVPKNDGPENGAAGEGGDKDEPSGKDIRKAA